MPDLSTLALVVVASQLAAVPVVAVVGMIGRALGDKGKRLHALTGGKTLTRLALHTFAVPLLALLGAVLVFCLAMAALADLADNRRARRRARERARARAWLIRNGGI